MRLEAAEFSGDSGLYRRAKTEFKKSANKEFENFIKTRSPEPAQFWPSQVQEDPAKSLIMIIKVASSIFHENSAYVLK